VPQDNFLFSDTIRANIDFGMEKPDEVPNAAILADVDDNITQFPLGYETVLGERGVTVSGGQKQRISIARALLRDAPILILDDSVSAVDTRTEKTILENLQNVRQGKTTILIAHRISTVQTLDKLLFLEDGKLTAVGSHDQLLASCPAYAKMVQLQALEAEGGELNV
jgi:ATP-binding cassette subfamily B protein